MKKWEPFDVEQARAEIAARKAARIAAGEALAPSREWRDPIPLSGDENAVLGQPGAPAAPAEERRRREWTRTRSHLNYLLFLQRRDAPQAGADPSREAEIAARFYREGFRRAKDII